jgi:sugar lactone lactonase YvrE
MESDDERRNPSHAFNLYVSEQLGNSIRIVSPSGAVSTFATGLDHPSGLAFDNNYDKLYVANYKDGLDAVPGYISAIDKNGTPTSFGPPLQGPISLAFDKAGYLYVGLASRGTVQRLSPDGSIVTPFASGFLEPAGLAFYKGDLLVAELLSAEAGVITRVQPNGIKTTFATGLRYPIDIAVRDHEVFVAQEEVPHIVKITNDGRKVEPFVQTIDGGPGSICLAPDGNFYVVGSFGSHLYRIPPEGKVATLFSGATFNSARYVRFRSEG